MMIKRSNRGKLSGSLGGRALLDTREGTQRKRSLWSLITAAVAIALVGLFTVGTGVSYADAPSTTDSAPEHHKTLKYNADGTYDVTLTVQGKVESNTHDKPKPVDVIIVLDRSRSMADGIDGNKNPVEDRLALSKKAADSLIDTVFSSKNLDPRVSVVDFGTYARAYTNDYTASMNAGYAAWYANADSAKTAISKVSYPKSDDSQYGGGTNWQDAFKVANAIPVSKNSDNSSRGANRYIIFLSDGNPTYRDEYRGNDNSRDRPRYTYGANYSYGYIYMDIVSSQPEEGSYSYFGMAASDYQGYNFECGMEEANRRGATTLYCIGLSSDPTKMQDFAGQTNSSCYYSATDTSGLNDAFANIAADITGSNKSYKGVTITDTLSDWAEFADPSNVQFTYQKNGNEYSPSKSATVSDSGKSKKVTWEVSDSKDDGGDTTLDDGAIYSITFKVRPNQAAYDRALKIKNNADEPDPGKDATDEANPNDPAIFSNVNDDKNATGVSGIQTTTITNNGSPSSSTDAGFSSAYDEKPVMHVPVSCVTVKKAWDESVLPGMRGNVSVELQKKSGNDWVTVDGNLVLSEANKWTATKYVVAGVGEQTYRVVETGIANQDKNAFNISCAYSKKGDKTNSLDSLTFEGRKHCEGTATITNSLKVYTLTITKKVTGNFGDTSKAFSFTLTDASDKAITNVKAVEGTSDDVRLENNGSFTLKNDQKLVVELPYGASYKVVENVPNDPKGAKDTVGYTTTIDAGDSGANIDNEKRIASSPEAGITKETTITYTNKRDVKPEVGVDLGSGAPYAAVFGGAGLAGVIWMVLKRRNSLGI